MEHCSALCSLLTSVRQSRYSTLPCPAPCSSSSLLGGTGVEVPLVLLAVIAAEDLVVVFFLLVPLTLTLVLVVVGFDVGSLPSFAPIPSAGISTFQ